ncbi:tyrosine-type recombinase/integrase [Nocardia terpenica]|uniref:tyrosine-type recombinase/integrase n=1 Tax=Nocardia terpenica TaxID=455432 RepID=UPI001895C9FE|nr:tyrosine-type recombinase/integrase [Nocardia terpenica]MBF6063281.1 tyrosine-type recombinase/integrase [Nocardia terpenica]MBF6105837.1 tyrosine-type recombinase/integrase [Nocardia terpenica]MBF6113579.1 tyrosine-type recombinase/integrase [Nocardia terpenica]MBF6119578.1 tyrosine-type recombinase/integrase [Nocardia terpenica]MBF6151989.1 tyrosine-type recombinase/integrase [Nocardia terpenica]
MRSKLIRCAPKDESRRDVDLPIFLWDLLMAHIARTQPRRCECHGAVHVFRGNVRRRAVGNPKGVNLLSVAKLAGVSERSAQVAFSGSGRLGIEARERVLEAAADLGYKPRVQGEVAAHWSRSSFREWVYVPAVTGKYPPNNGRPERPVPISSDVFPGLPIKGAHPWRRADLCWMPIVDDARPHRNRHSLRTDLEEAGIPKVLIDERIGHADGSVHANYTHITESMRDRLCDVLTEMWYSALDLRLAMSPTSPVAVLNDLLQARALGLGAAAA